MPILTRIHWPNGDPMSDRYTAPAFYNAGKTVGIGDTDIWNNIFPDNGVDWKNGWKMYWDHAGSRYGAGTDYDPAIPKVELQVFHENGHKSNLATAFPENFTPISMQSMAIASMVLNVCNQHGPAKAFVADTVCSKNAANARPTLTIICESPKGGIETARQLQEMLVCELRDVSITCRSIRNNVVGIVKATFHPEIYEVFDTGCLQMDWRRWWNLVEKGDTTAYNAACLMWADRAAGAVLAMKREIPLVMHSIYFDYCQSVAFTDGHSVETALRDPEIIKFRLMGMIPSRLGLAA